MAERPALDRWLATVDELLDDPLLVGRRLGVVPQERGRHLELRYGTVLGDEYLQLCNLDPETGRRQEGLLIRKAALGELARHLHQLRRYLGSTVE